MPDFVETPDFLNTSSLLRQHSKSREVFKPDNSEHRKSLQNFIKTGNWGDVKFFCEAPYTDVPTTVLMAFASFELKTKRNTLAEQTAFLSKKNLSGFIIEDEDDHKTRIDNTNMMTLQKVQQQ